MDEAIRRQDRAAKLGLFRLGEKIKKVPADDVEGLDTRDAVAIELGCEFADIEILTICPDHPDESAVDCPHH